MKIPDLYKKKYSKKRYERYELLTSAEVCRILKISRPTLYRMVKSGAIPAIKVGGTLRFRIDAVITYFETRTGGDPLTFGAGVMEKYRNDPSKYRVRPIKKGQGGWIEIIELYRQSMATGTVEGLIRYHEARWPDGRTVIIINRPQFNRLPPEEKMHFQRFELT